ncbi:hypothetical protein MSI_21090 [Treponema sp. JC4]|uniref:nickel pincer cofactor biosynthesis protein LarC n=1 Tax=Treponema sp. JC4 TaxID=1124982 RepID=UPI00025B0AED|nr:nickel pincer cofactor biosynthesis protein LarC [Treponema sp. JC4]EID84414.1 hypothetical protein MSI_21090 [Treponema sp. JC4]
MKDLYLECNAGISGDMAVAALLEAGADKDELLRALDSIPAKGFKVEISRVKKNGIEACDFKVILDQENHDHDMEYLFGHEEGEHPHLHEEEHHHHDHHHLHEHEASLSEHQHHDHRNLADVLAVIDGTKLSDRARNLARRIFEIIAQAESKAHGLPLDEVHFHEVGALDSIVDVIALAVCYDNLSPDHVYVPYLCEGTGTIRCQHGILPIPVPAVADILSTHSIPLQIIPDHGEFVTPTGAAFIAAVMTDKALPKNFVIKKIGLGAGKRAYARTNILRAMIIENHSSDDDQTSMAHNQVLPQEPLIYKLESNIDDCPGEALGFVMEELMAAGAHDVHYIPCMMKKNRPAYLLNVICKEKDMPRLEKIIFTHTTTIGIRRIAMNRTILERELLNIQTPYGESQVKIVQIEGKKRFYPEYESVAKIVRKNGKAFGDIYREIINLCENSNIEI